jgi:ATP-dependent helicase HrpB
VAGPDSKPVKLLYPESPDAADDEAGLHPETQVKLHECWAMEAHPTVAEGRVPVRIWLQAPDGKRLDSTLNWKAWKAGSYPRIRPQLKVKYPGFVWP